MPPKFFWYMEGRKCDFTRKGCFSQKKSVLSEKSWQVLSFCKMKNVQAHEISGLALQKKKLEENSVDYMRTTGTNVDFCHFIKSSFTVKLMVGC